MGVLKSAPHAARVRIDPEPRRPFEAKKTREGIHALAQNVALALCLAAKPVAVLKSYDVRGWRHAMI